MLIENCNICQKSGKIRFDLGNYRVSECVDCRFRWVQSDFDERQYISSDYYWAEGYFAKNENEMRRLAKREVNEIIKTFNALGLKEKTWIDFGCGFGYLISEAAKEGFDVCGVEAKQKIASLVKEREGLNIINSLIDELDLGTKKYSVATFFDVLEHLIKPKEALLKAKAMLSDGGLLVVEVPDDDSLIRRCARWQYFLTFGVWNSLLRQSFHCHPAGHRNGFTRRAIIRLLEQSGFSVLDVRKAMMPFNIFMSESVRGKRGFVKLIYLFLSAVFWILSVALGMHNRIKFYARKN